VIDRHAGNAGVPGQQRGQRGELVGVVVAVEQRRREIVRHLLQAQHVEVREAARLGDDPRGVDAAVVAAAPLDVPGEEAHGEVGNGE
jgi:3-deoxy-D-manno-octulosonate 8-phosphate phosphatase KdsC-like HAD superfamily phosphatase